VFGCVSLALLVAAFAARRMFQRGAFPRGTKERPVA
jgi:hypothetical protein